MLPSVHSAGKTIPWTDLVLPWNVARHLHRHGRLIRQFVVREVLSRYRGSYLGLCWSLLRPLAMLALYTVVFGYIFESKLGNRPTESKLDFTLTLFCGLILFDFFAECLTRAPTLVLTNTNYVTKVVFPLEILPVTTVGAALTQLLISFLPLFAGLALTHGAIPLTAAYLPVILLPLILFCLGLTWLLAAAGVFLRDLSAVVPVLTTITMYASAIFYSIRMVPAHLLPLVHYNPVAITIDQMRNAVLWGTPPPWGHYGVMLGVASVTCLLGYTFFMRTKHAFADVM